MKRTPPSVIKRNGIRQPIQSSKIQARIERAANDLSLGPLTHVDVMSLSQNVVSEIHDGITTVELDIFAFQKAASMNAQDPENGELAKRLAVSKLQKEAPKLFSDCVFKLATYINPENGKPAPLVSKKLVKLVKQHKETIDNYIKPERDYNYSYLGFRTLCSGYLLKTNGKITETPQYMLMRVCLGMHGDNLEHVFRTYDMMSQLQVTHASPTLFNCGTPRSQCSSCFLVHMSDSLEGIYGTVSECAKISKYGGGIGINIHTIRSRGSYIAGTHGHSNGIIPMLRLLNASACYADQGGGHRKGAYAIYLAAWHFEIFEFLDIKKNSGDESMRARDLFTAIWAPDLFFERVKEGADWPLFDPVACPGLPDLVGDAFKERFEMYEKQGKAKKVVSAKSLWIAMLKAMIETGGPYLLAKDACNKKSNQQNLGTIYGSNLCTEIMQVSNEEETAVCNLASINLSQAVKFNAEGVGQVDYDGIYERAYQLCYNLNRVIDINFYPDEKTRKSNMRHRPMGISALGFADMLIKLRVPYDSETARSINKKVFETIYFAALSCSVAEARKHGPYESYPGSPYSLGKMQWDLWGISQEEACTRATLDWETLRGQIRTYGLRNSLLLTVVPGASTSQIMNSYECLEPITSNIMVRRTLAGEFTVINQYLVEDLRKIGLWTEDIRTAIIAANGSIQGITIIPKNIRELYKTVWEIGRKCIIDMHRDRGLFIDQSQSMNLYLESPTVKELSKVLMYGWKKGLKTLLYYLKQRPAADPIKFTVEKEALDRLMLSGSIDPDTYRDLSQSLSSSPESLLPKMSQGDPQDVRACPLDPKEREECLYCT